MTRRRFFRRPKRRQVTIRMSKAARSSLAEAAKREGVSMSELVRRIASAALESPPTIAEAYEPVDVQPEIPLEMRDRIAEVAKLEGLGMAQWLRRAIHMALA